MNFPIIPTQGNRILVVIKDGPIEENAVFESDKPINDSVLNDERIF